ncbi:digestive cysteine proteinase 3-like isoform X2 [Brevipalpus obovatus]|uniref:digestive cysteine proteinase 3-like isoform X2 n=1 Tax=Brevipalpus obovatus TaxID=246614 RepID=UPI003D9E6DDF
MRLISNCLIIFNLLTMAYSGHLSDFLPDYVPIDVDQYETYWDEFKTKYSKEYSSPAEESYRKRVFSQNLDLITEHNLEADKGTKSFKLGVNRFCDQTPEEFKEEKSQLTSSDESSSNLIEIPGLMELFSIDSKQAEKVAASMDWRKVGIINKPVDQKECGACWAFSAVTAIEAQLAISRGKLYRLSAQQLLDCSGNNMGCEGGLMTTAFTDLIGTEGLVEDSSYPYAGDQGMCRASKMKPKFGHVLGFGIVESVNETALKYAVHQKGPITVGIDSKSPYFRYYWKGIYDDVFCSNNLNHAITIVGYGTDEMEGDYWIIKNSWGTDWGEDGYARIKRGKNLCGMSLIPSYPILKE